VVSDGVFDKMTEEKSPEGIICVVKHIDKLHKIVKMNNEDMLRGEIGKSKIFAVESVRDPGNMGTILRSAAAFGTDLVVLSSDCADLLNPKTVRGAMGAIFRQPTVVFSDLSEAIAILRQNGRRVFGAALDRKAWALSKSTLRTGDCIVVGNEGHGLTPETLAACDEKLFIPMEKDSESLNAAIAASVLLWSMYSGF
jgi:TrmH family RNA methyltransferase